MGTDLEREIFEQLFDRVLHLPKPKDVPATTLRAPAVTPGRETRKDA